VQSEEVAAVSITYDGTFGVANRARPARPAPARRPARLTRRGRIVVVLFVLALLAVAFSVGVSSQAAGPSRPHAVPTVTVRPGESLWQVAVRVAPGADPRLVVDELQRVNHLSSATVQSGQQLIVPG